LYFRIFSAFFFTTFLFPEIAASVNIHVPISLALIMMSGLFCRRGSVSFHFTTTTTTATAATTTILCCT
jgi:hypothetical protein